MNPLYLAAIPVALLLVLARTAHAPGAEPTSTWSPRPRWWAAPAPTPVVQRPELVAAAARKWSTVFRVPVGWLRSMAYAESQNVPGAVNKVTGAMGVLQLLPDTATWLVASLKKTNLAKNRLVAETLSKIMDLKSLLDVDVNVMLAAYYLSLLKKRFAGDPDLVAAAYNMGPNKIAYYADNNLPLPERSRVYLAMVAEGRRRGYA
jgi:soluble lytic murein transglycosylase-like protein